MRFEDSRRCRCFGWGLVERRKRRRRRRRKKWALGDEQKEYEKIGWKGETMEHGTGREEDEPRGEKTRGAKKKMEGGGATRPSDDLMSSPSPGLK